MPSERPAPVDGELFIRNYLKPAGPLSDSVRARRRFGAYLYDDEIAREKLPGLVTRQLGIDYPFAVYGYNHTEYWNTASIGDILSTLTIWIKISSRKPATEAMVRQVLKEEHLRYRLDDKGGIHYLVDDEFERTVASTIAGLGSTKFAASLHALEEALAQLGGAKQSGKGLIRGVFEAVESAFLVTVAEPASNRLNAASVDKHLKPLLLTHYVGQPDAGDLVARMLKHFMEWVNSAHPFRHGAAFEDIHEAPLDLAVMSATQGMSYLRFLAGLATSAGNT